MRVLKSLFLGGAMFFVPAVLNAQAVAPELAFGARPSVWRPKLSPDGARLSFIAPDKVRGNAVYVVPTDGSTPAKRVVVASGEPERLRECGWVSNQRMVCSIFYITGSTKYPFGASRLVAFDADGGRMKVLHPASRSASKWYNFGGEIIDWLPGQGDSVLIKRYFSDGYAVDRIDTNTAEAHRVVQPIPNASHFLSDGVGNVRIYGFEDRGPELGVLRYSYRNQSGGTWQRFASYDRIKQKGFYPWAVDPAENVVYGWRFTNGRDVVVKITLDEAARETLVFSRPDVDIDAIVRIGRRNKVVGFGYVTDRREWVYFDKAYQTLHSQIKKILPEDSLISFDDESDDGSKLLVWAENGAHPGKYYLYDRGARQLRPLLLMRPELDGFTLGVMKPIHYPAADGTMVPAYLTLPRGSNGKGLPAIVLPHTDIWYRDELGFDWLAQYYVARGFAVLQPNFRGTRGYGAAWAQGNGVSAWRAAVGDVIDGGRWLVSQGIADPGRLAIVGRQYGGYLALQSAVTAPDLFKAIVSISPFTDIEHLRDKYQHRYGDAGAEKLIASGPDIKLGSPARNVSAFRAPVLLLHGEQDLNIPIASSKLMASRLQEAGKSVEFITYPGLDHGLDDATARADMLGKSDAFLRKSMGM